MKAANQDLINLLAGTNQLVMWDVYTITLSDGSVLTYTSGDAGIVSGCVYEDFSAGLAPYSTVSGNAALFSIVSSPYGNALAYAGVTSGTVNSIRRALTATSAVKMRAKFMVVSTSVDDACSVVFEDASQVIIAYINPRRESAFDATQRVRLTLGGDSVPVGSAAASFGVWYQVTITVVPGAGNSTYSVARVDNGAVLGAGAFASSHAVDTVASLLFLDDPTLGSAPTRFADISVCPQ